MSLKRIFKRNTHNLFFKALAGLGKSMYRFYENRNHDALSNGEATVLKKISQLNPKIIFDVGANIGNYTELILRTNPGSKVFSFEPVNNTFKRLESKFRKQSGEKVHLIKKGLFNKNTQIEINIYPGHEHASLFNIKGIDYQSIGKELIDLMAYDFFVHQEQIAFVDFVKLDLEGAEMGALQGMVQNLAEKKIRAVQFEYGYINITTKNLLADYYEFFNSFNYCLGKIYPKTVEFREYKFKHEDFIGPNFIAVHKNDSELISILSK